eukprot:c4552_g1_i1.p1 GENE.c4552_g1_i1~~c4552_g1_i1.p1  ORF type:complete len:437 (+),score=105.02 c4552_g1_i1:44-1354(+)
MYRRCLLVCLLFLGVSGAFRKTLVLLDNSNIQSSHSQFIQSLRDRGQDVTIKLVNADDIEIKKYGEFLFNNIVLLSPEAKGFGGDLDDAALLEFVDSGNNLVITASAKASKTIRELVSDCGVELDDKKSVVIDHFNYDVSDSDGSHTLILANHFSKSSILDSQQFAPVLYQGVGLTLDPENPLSTKLLFGAPTTYSSNPSQPIDKSPSSAGANTVLVAAVQTRNNGRVLISGSLDLFSNRFFNSAVAKGSSVGPAISAAVSGNAKFADTVIGWTFQERGVLRHRSLFHRKADGSSLFPRMYRVKDDVVFSVVIEEYDGKTDSWKPFKQNDVQLEFRMLGPYVRTFLNPSDDGTFSVEFKIPDVYGVFKFHIDYKRDGYSHIVVSQEVGVRPFRHNEFERFIASANPYYLSYLSMMGGFVLLSVVFLFTKDSKEKKA